MNRLARGAREGATVAAKPSTDVAVPNSCGVELPLSERVVSQPLPADGSGAGIAP
ncbi:hypothetical protein ACH4E7_27780 [Kitasatospora sp. NPDC018058]|uniref:hypothetical protein n=1 Tax=Kitasatospora sp. NPDC018058 TaxID=3364025 RepID=UPI0037C138B6